MRKSTGKPLISQPVMLTPPTQTSKQPSASAAVETGAQPVTSSDYKIYQMLNSPYPLEQLRGTSLYDVTQIPGKQRFKAPPTFLGRVGQGIKDAYGNGLEGWKNGWNAFWR